MQKAIKLPDGQILDLWDEAQVDGERVEVYAGADYPVRPVPRFFGRALLWSGLGTFEDTWAKAFHDASFDLAKPPNMSEAEWDRLACIGAAVLQELSDELDWEVTPDPNGTLPCRFVVLLRFEEAKCTS